jgi:alkylation response protein AidB-like acyl-CoA dehydrogenase
MNFDFSDEQKQMRDEARKFLAEKCPPKAVRAVLDGKVPYDKDLWKGLAEMGFLGVAIPEKFGGAGAGHLELCVIAEEMGRALAPVPFSSTVYLAAEALVIAGSDAQKQKWLPKIASGEAIGTLALFEGKGNPSPKAIKLAASGGTLNGVKKPVPDGAIADFAIVAARTGSSGRESDISLFIVDLGDGGIEIKGLTNVDLTRGQAEITFTNAKAEPLGANGEVGCPHPGARPCRGVAGVRAGWRRRPRARNGPRLRAGPYRLRPPDRLVPGGQAYARRHVCLGDAGAFQLLLRRLGTLD